MTTEQSQTLRDDVEPPSSDETPRWTDAYHDIGPDERVMRVYRDGSYLLQTAARTIRCGFDPSQSQPAADETVRALRAYHKPDCEQVMYRNGISCGDSWSGYFTEPPDCTCGLDTLLSHLSVSPRTGEK